MAEAGRLTGGDTLGHTDREVADPRQAGRQAAQSKAFAWTLRTVLLHLSHSDATRRNDGEQRLAVQDRATA